VTVREHEQKPRQQSGKAHFTKNTQNVIKPHGHEISVLQFVARGNSSGEI
jgi:hypothetical protein